DCPRSARNRESAAESPHWGPMSSRCPVRFRTPRGRPLLPPPLILGRRGFSVRRPPRFPAGYFSPVPLRACRVRGKKRISGRTFGIWSRAHAIGLASGGRWMHTGGLTPVGVMAAGGGVSGPARGPHWQENPFEPSG